MISLLFQIFLISFLFNLVWEVIHSQLYITCLESSLKRYIPLIIGASLKDGFWITSFFLFSAYIFGNVNILTNIYQLICFTFFSLVFSFIDERISLKMKRWEYSRKMPTIFRVGVTPLFEVAITGILTFMYVFLV